MIQFVSPTLTTISCAVIAKLDKPSVRDLQLLRIGLAALKEGSDVYPSGTVRIITEGRGIHTYVTPDSAILSVTLPVNTKSNAAEIMVSLLKEPSFSDDAITKAIGALRRESSDYWINEVNPHPFVLRDATKDDILGAFHRIFKLDNLYVGEFSPKALSKDASIWATATADWAPPTEESLTLEDLVVPLPTGNTSRVSTGELIGVPIDPTSPEFAPDILALYALGAGKTSSLFRIAREQHAWSYRQESLIFGEVTGFSPRLFLAMSPDTENLKRLAALREELKADVKTWTDQNLQAALGLADSNLSRHLPYGPFIFPDQPLSEDPEQRLDFALYWKAKTGQDWSPSLMLAAMQLVELPALKAAATRILVSSQIHYLPAEY